MRKLLLVIVLAILYGSFYPWHFAYVPDRPFLQPVSFYYKSDLVLNCWLYVPVGALAYWVFARVGILRWVLPVCLGLVLSTFVEIIQYFIPVRLSSQTDILANLLGTVLGMFLAAWAGSAPDLSRWRFRRSPEAALLVCWTALLLFPLFPVHGFFTLRLNVRAFLASPFLWTDLLIWTIAWLVVWELVPGAFVRSRYWMVASLLLLLLPARVFLIMRVLTKAELAAGLAAVCIPFFLPKRRIAPWALFAAILVALAVRGLAPFTLSPLAAPFGWIPLSGVLNSEWQAAMRTLIGKLFWYGSAVWALHRCPVGLGWSGAIVAGLLLGIEIIQRHMPAHVPEITDPLLALMCAAAFHLILRPQVSRATDQQYALQPR